MPQTDPSVAAQLKDLRARIDVIDADLHRLLIDRSAIIEQLIAVKRTDEPGAAFRPAREAEMMRALVDRHAGRLPLVTVEHVWREVISTFTWLQAPYAVHVATGDAAETRDVARFYFGFTVPFETAEAPADAIAAVARSMSDLAVVRLGESTAPWWVSLDSGPHSPRVISRLPFIDVPDRPVGTPAIVISMPLKEPVQPEIAAFACRGPADPVAHDWLRRNGVDVIAWHAPWGRHTGAIGADLIVAVPAGGRDPMAVAEETVLRARENAGIVLADVRLIGGYAAPIPMTPHR